MALLRTKQLIKHPVVCPKHVSKVTSDDPPCQSAPLLRLEQVCIFGGVHAVDATRVGEPAGCHLVHEGTPGSLKVQAEHDCQKRLQHHVVLIRKSKDGHGSWGARWGTLLHHCLTIIVGTLHPLQQLPGLCLHLFVATPQHARSGLTGHTQLLANLLLGPLLTCFLPGPCASLAATGFEILSHLI